MSPILEVCPPSKVFLLEKSSLNNLGGDTLIVVICGVTWDLINIYWHEHLINELID